jgi:hypothetical protein
MNDREHEVARQIHLAQAQELHRQQHGSPVRLRRDCASRVKDELSFRLEIGDLDISRDCCDWLNVEHPEALAQIMNPGELSHKEVIDRWRARWIDAVIAGEGWGIIDIRYHLGVE